MLTTTTTTDNRQPGTRINHSSREQTKEKRKEKSPLTENIRERKRLIEGFSWMSQGLNCFPGS